MTRETQRINKDGDELFDMLLTIQVVLREKLNESLRANRHPNTGQLQKSFAFEIVNDDTLQFICEEYGVVLNDGVKPSRIPFGGNTGKAKTSAYIQGLKSWAQSKLGVSAKESTSVAFAIARVHKKKGMPKRRDWIGNALQSAREDIEELIKGKFPQIYIDNILKQL